MPTGYTADLAAGPTTFRAFVLGCARAFGACLSLRDDPMGGDRIPEEFTVEPYYHDALKRAHQEQHAWWAASEAERRKQYKLAQRTEQDEYEERVERNAERAARYESMLAQVEGWEPPTPDHVNLKEFMREQLTRSMEWDCCEPTPPASQTFAVWCAQREHTYARSVEYAEESLARQQEVVARNNAWVKALRDSLKEAR